LHFGDFCVDIRELPLPAVLLAMALDGQAPLREGEVLQSTRDMQQLAVPTPMRKRTFRRSKDTSTSTSATDACSKLHEAHDEAPVCEGDMVTLTRDFMSSTLVRVPLMAGWQGRIVRIDAVGDALIQFENHVKLQWISKRHLVHIKRQFHAEVPSDMEPAFRVSAAQVTDVDGKRGFPVWLHVYDLGRASKVLLNNCWLARQGGWGAFHCGLEVLGIEFSFQAVANCHRENDTTSGVTWHLPRSHPRHIYREALWLGTTSLGMSEILSLLERLEKEWPARNYHCLRNNCTDFAAKAASSLQVSRPFPRWVHGVAKGLLAVVPSVTGGAQLPCCSSWDTLVTGVEFAKSQPGLSGRQDPL